MLAYKTLSPRDTNIDIFFNMSIWDLMATLKSFTTMYIQCVICVICTVCLCYMCIILPFMNDINLCQDD